MTEASTAQINARIAHIRLVYGDADQDAALLEALLKDRGRVKALEDALRTKAAMIELGEKIAWGSDVALMREAADALAASQPAPQVQPGAPIKLAYTNWKGETAQRTIIPRHIWWGSNEWHPEPQWLLTAFDVDKQAERYFALKDFGQPAQPVAVKLDTSCVRAMLDAAERHFAHLNTISATIRVNALRHGATDAEVDDFISGKADFVAWLQDQVKPQPFKVEEAARDAELLLSAYKGLLVLHRMMVKAGLHTGEKTTSELADKIVSAHPEFPALAAQRAIEEAQQ